MSSAFRGLLGLAHGMLGVRLLVQYTITPSEVLGTNGQWYTDTIHRSNIVPISVGPRKRVAA